MIYSVECDSEKFENLVRGNATFVITENCTNFQTGDYLAINEKNEDDTGYTGRSAMFVIDYIMDSEKSNYMIDYNFVVLGLRPCTVINTAKRGCDVLTGKERKL